MRKEIAILKPKIKNTIEVSLGSKKRSLKIVNTNKDTPINTKIKRLIKK